MIDPNFVSVLRYLHRGGMWAYWWLADSPSQDRGAHSRTQSIWWPASQQVPSPPVSAGRNVYFGVHPCRVRRGPGQRATIKTIAAINCLYAEFDITGDDDKAAVLARIERIEPPPAVIVDSGGGYHAYWLLDEPLLLIDDATQERARAAQYAWVAYTGADPAAKDLARVLRVPGTTNYKPKYAPDYPPVQLVGADLTRTCSLAELERAAGSVLRAPLWNDTAPHRDSSFTDLDDLARAARALERLSHARCDSYDGWLHVGMALHAGLGDSGLSLWNAWSQRSARYEAGSCERKWQTFDAGRHGYTLASLFYWADEDDPAGALALQRSPRASTSGRTAVACAEGDQRQEAPDVSSADTAEDSLAEALHLTDMGNAQRLIRRHGGDLRYVQEWGWLTWDGRRWQLDRSGEVMRRAKETALAILDEAEGPMAERARAKILAWARASQSRSRLEAMIALAQSEVGVPAATDAFDTHDWLLNCRNGTVDLRTGDVRPHRREDLLTRLVDVDYDPGALCPTWEQFLDRIMDGSEALTGYLQRAIGYALTGDTGEQAMFLLYGTGANGKSTFLEVIRAIAGDYGRQSDPTTFLARQNSDRIPNDIARLAGARFVSAIEVEEGRRLSEVLIKQVVSGDTLTARFLNREFFEFRARFKLFLAANHKPVVRGTDEGIWRRIRLIPFTVTIPKAERDRTLLTRLQGELPGILAWAVRGCLDFTHGGLADPPAVLAATDSYRSEMDVIGAFVAERCVVAEHARAECAALYSAYAQWCEENGEHAVSQRRFGQQLEERRFARRRGTNGKWCRSGIGLLDDRSGGSSDGPGPDGDPPPHRSGPFQHAQVEEVPDEAPEPEQEGLDLPEEEPEVIQVTQGDPTFRVPADHVDHPGRAGISWSYVRRLLAIGDALSLEAVRTHCLLAGVPVEQVIGQARDDAKEASAPSRGSPDGV